MNKNLALRFISALLPLPLILFLFWKGGPYAMALVGLVSAIVAAELYGIVGLSVRHPAALYGILASASTSYFLQDLPARWPALLTLLVATPIVSLGLLTLLPPDDDLKKAAPSSAFVALGPPYVGLCLAFMVGLREISVGDGFGWIFVALTVTWGNDTGAYFAGRFLGNRKLYELVSPSKTWAGFWGGMVTSVGGCFIVSATLLPSLRPIDCVLLGLVAGVLGPLGDLAESMLKRAYDVKDSGTIMPGHGGIFDRVDALLFNAPWVYLYASYLKSIV